MREAERAKIRAAIARAFDKQRKAAAKDTPAGAGVSAFIGPDKTPPWYEGGLFWGCVGAFIALVLYTVGIIMPGMPTAIGSMVGAWCFGTIAVYAAFRGWRSTLGRWTLTVLGSLVIAGMGSGSICVRAKVFGLGLETLEISPPVPPAAPDIASGKQPETSAGERPLSFVFLYRDHKIEIDNMGKTEVSFWGTKLADAPAAMDDPRIFPIQPYNYHLDGNKLEPLLKAELMKTQEVRWPFDLFVKDSIKRKFTLKTVVRAVINDNGTLHIDMQNLGVFAGWLTESTMRP